MEIDIPGSTLYNKITSQTDRTLNTYVYVDPQNERDALYEKYKNNGLNQYITYNHEQNNDSVTIRLDISDNLPTELDGFNQFQTYFYIEFYDQATNGTRVSMISRWTAPHIQGHQALVNGGTIRHTFNFTNLQNQQGKYFRTRVRIINPYPLHTLYESNWSSLEQHVHVPSFTEPSQPSQPQNPCNVTTCNAALLDALNNKRNFGQVWDDDYGRWNGSVPVGCEYCPSKGYQVSLGRVYAIHKPNRQVTYPIPPLNLDNESVRTNIYNQLRIPN